MTGRITDPSAPRGVWRLTGLTAAAALMLCAGKAAAQDSGGMDPLEALLAAQQAREAQNAAQPAPDRRAQPPRPGTNAVGEDPADEDPEDLAGDGVRVSEFMTVDIFVNDEDLNNVLQLLSVQSQRNIVVSKNVSATVSANFYGVTIEEALDALLHINGFRWVEEGNFIYVYTQEEFEAIEEQQRQLESRVIRLNYLKAEDAAEFVRPLLSDRGELVFNGSVTEFTLPEDSPAGGEDFALEATLVVYDFAEHLDEIVAMVEALDEQPQQVLVEATILQTRLNEANAFGIDFAYVNDLSFLDFFDFGGPLGSALALGQVAENQVAPTDNTASAVTSRVGNYAGPATFRTAVIADDVAIFLRLLDEVTDLTILSKPNILALNRQPARVLVGQKLGYLNTTSTETATTQTVEFLDTGTQLVFRPFISKDGMIRLELQPQVSEGIIRETTDGLGAAVTIPDEITQQITTNVLVPDGGTVVLGGLFREATTLTRRQVPVLGDIPIVGSAFRGHEDDTQREEIVFMITPTIMNNQQLLDQGERSVQYAERVRVGTREGLLPFSRDKQTALLNMKAERLAKEGKFDQAMHLLRRSLELNPTQPDARRLREALFNQHEVWPDRSILHEIIEDEIGMRYEDAPSSMGLSSPVERPVQSASVEVPVVGDGPSLPLAGGEPTAAAGPEPLEYETIEPEVVTGTPAPRVELTFDEYEPLEVVTIGGGSESAEEPSSGGVTVTYADNPTDDDVDTSFTFAPTRSQADRADQATEAPVTPTTQPRNETTTASASPAGGVERGVDLPEVEGVLTPAQRRAMELARLEAEFAARDAELANAGVRPMGASAAPAAGQTAEPTIEQMTADAGGSAPVSEGSSLWGGVSQPGDAPTWSGPMSATKAPSIWTFPGGVYLPSWWSLPAASDAETRLTNVEVETDN